MEITQLQKAKPMQPVFLVPLLTPSCTSAYETLQQLNLRGLM
jgi:hypothetical protein